MATKGRKTVAIIVVVFGILIAILLVYAVVVRRPRNQAAATPSNSKNWPKAPIRCNQNVPSQPNKCASTDGAICTACVRKVGTGANLEFEDCDCSTMTTDSSCLCSVSNSCKAANERVCSQTKKT